MGRYLQGRRRGYFSIDEGSFTESSPSSGAPYSAPMPAEPAVRPTPHPGEPDLPRLQTRAAPVPATRTPVLLNAPPATRCRLLRRAHVRNCLYVRTSAAASTRAEADGRRGLTCGGRCENSIFVHRMSSYRAVRVADRVRQDRPGHAAATPRSDKIARSSVGSGCASHGIPAPWVYPRQRTWGADRSGEYRSTTSARRQSAGA